MNGSSQTTATASTGPAWMRHFQRITSRGDLVREIDGLRFFALAGVYLLHLNHSLMINAPQIPQAEHSLMTECLEYGAFGVQLFFVISGFILALPFARHYLADGKPVSMKAYYLRRITRLEPPLIVNLTVVLLLMVVGLHRPLSALFPHYAATCVYLHSAIFGAPSIINPVTWSLEVEAQFYIAMPLLARVFAIRSLVQRRVVLFSALIFFGVITRMMPRATLPAQMAYFLVGFIVADLWLCEWKGKLTARRGYDALALISAALLCAALFWHHYIPFPDVTLAFLLLAFTVTALNSHALGAFLRHWIPVTLGGSVTPSIYITQWFSPS